MGRVRQLVVGTAALVAAVGVGDVTPVTASGVRAVATVMTGAQEVPGPGDPDGIGAAGVLVNVDRGRVCYVLAVKHIDPAVAAHIHRGAAGVAGPVVVPLDPPSARGFSANCADVDAGLAAEIAQSPGNFYVNVHTAAFMDGAIRGQLR